VTVGIPVYNEEALLRVNTLALADYLRARDPDFEILLGSNGSTDRTVAIGTALVREVPQVRFFHLPERGVGRVFRRFVELARYEHFVSMDMDLAVDLAFIDQALKLLRKADIVVGSKITGSQRRPLYRHFGSWLFVSLASRTLGIDFDDFSIGAKAYRVPLVKRYAALISDGSAYVLDLVYYVQRDGGRVMQIPVACEDHRRSRFHLGREAAHKFGNLARLWWRRRVRIT
jgi:glycosyltransferase involved in cell wall biosynthesis